MVYCGKCGTDNPDSNSYCSKCGAALTAPVPKTNTPVKTEVSSNKGIGIAVVAISLIAVAAIGCFAFMQMSNDDSSSYIDLNYTNSYDLYRQMGSKEYEGSAVFYVKNGTSGLNLDISQISSSSSTTLSPPTIEYNPNPLSEVTQSPYVIYPKYEPLLEKYEFLKDYKVSYSRQYVKDPLGNDVEVYKFHNDDHIIYMDTSGKVVEIVKKVEGTTIAFVLHGYTGLFFNNF